MTSPPDFAELALHPDELLALDRARALCDRQAGPLPEIFNPALERELLDVFVQLADWLEWRNRHRAAPQVTVEAIVWSVRESGVPALKHPSNVHRLRTLNPRQRNEVNSRIERFKEHSHAA